MKQWLVDTNVLLDVIGADQQFGPASKRVLERCARSGVMVINPVIYAELAAFMASREELEELLPAALFRRDAIPWEAAFLAGRAFERYRRRGGTKRRMLADFLIGAHAAVGGFGLISRDRGQARHFELELVDPAREKR